jgi:hypothetical protein
VAFTDSNFCLKLVDASYELNNEFITIQTKPLKRNEIRINHTDIKEVHAAWTCVGYHLVL